MFSSSIEVMVALAEARIVLEAVKGGVIEHSVGQLQPDSIVDIVLAIDTFENRIREIGLRELKHAVNEYLSEYDSENELS
jgi:hypothetical protein